MPKLKGRPAEAPPPLTAAAAAAAAAAAPRASAVTRFRALPRRHRAYRVVVALAIVVMLARELHVIGTFNHTFDEPYHIGAAVVLYESRKLATGAQHPPLARLVAGAPLMLQGVRLPEARDVNPEERTPINEYGAFQIGRDLIFSGKLPYWRMLISARIALLIFPVLTLLFTYRLGRWLWSPLAGAAAAVFLSVDPTFLGHSSWVGTDSAGAAGFVAGMYYGLRWLARPRSLRRALVAGVVLALAISCKYSCGLLVPSLLVVLVMRSLWRGRFAARKLPRARHIAVAAVIAFFVLWATFLFDTGPIRIQAMFDRESLDEHVPAALRETPVPMPSFWLGCAYLALRASEGHPTYLNGQISFTGWWYYFPEALLVKQSLAFLAAVVVMIVLLVSRRRAVLRTLALLVPCAMYLAVSMTSHYQLGIRHLLPILPLLYVAVVSQMIRLRMRALLVGLMVVGAVETAWIHPDYLAFFNAAAGGPRHGERYLIDSNLDWGQDLNRLAEWLKTSNRAKGRPYTIRAFGASGELMRTLGIDPAALEGKPRGLFAISKNYMHRLADARALDDGRIRLGDDYTWVTQYPLVKHIGYSIDVYDLDAAPSP